MFLHIAHHMNKKGWWKGEIDGKTGVFPENFVKIIKQNLNDDNLKKPDPSGARGVRFYCFAGL